jgi:K+-transporting ATPase, c chain
MRKIFKELKTPFLVTVIFTVISQQSALIQIPQISKSTGISVDNLKKIINKNTQNKTLGFLGEKTVNVLKVNLEIYNHLSEKSD